MIKKNLFSKMVFIYTVIIFLSLSLIATVLSIWFNDYYIQRKQQEVLEHIKIVEDLSLSYVEGDGNLSYEDLNSSLEFIGKYFYENVYLIDRNGYIFVSTAEKGKDLVGKQIFSDTEVILNDFGEKNTLKEVKKDNQLFSKGDYVLMRDIKDKNDEISSFILVDISMDYLKDSLSHIYKIIWLSTGIVMVLSIVIIYFFTDKIVIKPLQNMSAVAKKIANGDVEKRVEISSNDEIGQFAKAFNSMADSLEKVDRNRREFICNVSHDIRSPITSINGFIRGILDGVVPKEKESQYLTIAYEETQRLARLVNDLLDMSAIEEGRIKLALRKIDINEIIRLSILKNEGKIKEKKISVDVIFESDELLVYGDQDRIFQVILNLLDNAIKHSKEGTHINLSCTTKSGKAYISIENSASHIDEEELKNIWERFYKGDKSRTNRVSSGLGLSIVKKIINMLDEDVWVENTENGVMFTFTLTLV
ncbi:sensor histidine kinase [Clostridium senegalense]|uniref:sensor histidine kinase n=1 Tax=Clostridium senegalense TaxID=1465809 RepID=UPI000287E34B|nr:HAMP domain-containing sensor histidine kinase [Clostridium senegalense]